MLPLSLSNINTFLLIMNIKLNYTWVLDIPMANMMQNAFKNSICVIAIQK